MPEGPKMPIGEPESYKEGAVWEVPAVPIQNEVVAVNKHLKLPFNLKKGEPTKMGIFLTTNPGDEKTREVIAMDNHFRSVLLGQVIFEDDEGRKYRDVDLKGTGYLKRVWKGEKRTVRVKELSEDTGRNLERGDVPKGICERSNAEIDMETSEKLLKKGARVHRAVGIIKLNELIDAEGKKISLSEAKKRGIIKSSTEPVIEIRAFGTKARIWDAQDAQFLKDGKALIADELNIEKEQFSYLNYLEWFAKTMGSQAAILHNNNYWHRFLNKHNITLDCRIVDLDAITPMPVKINERLLRMQDDVWSALRALRFLFEKCEVGNFLGSDHDANDKFYGEMEKIFVKTYLDNLKENKNPERMKEMLDKILKDRLYLDKASVIS